LIYQVNLFDVHVPGRFFFGFTRPYLRYSIFISCTNNMCTAKKDKMAKKQLKTIPLTKSAEKVPVLVKLVFNSLYIL